MSGVPPGPTVSVVTPFYNTEAYLAACIESVLRQTYRDFEYVLVDNRSTDGSGAIAERYAAADPRIRLVRNVEHLAQIPNYNHALRQIAPGSRYCKLVQADDWVFPRCLEEMVAVADAHSSVGLVGAYTLIERTPYLGGLPYPSACVNGREICRRFLLEGTFVWGSPTATLVRADMVRARAAFYDEADPVEDVSICFDLLKDTDFGFVHQVLTFTRRENDSLMTRLKAYGSLQLAAVMALERHGPALLAPDELRACARRLHREHYDLLGEALLRVRPAAFWEFHRRGLRAVGRRLSRGRVLLHALGRAVRLLLNPLDTITRLAPRS